MALNNRIKKNLTIFIMFIDFIWMATYSDLFYGYHFTSRLYLIMLPDWLLKLNILLALTSFSLGILQLMNKIAFKKYFITNLLFYLLGFIAYHSNYIILSR